MRSIAPGRKGRVPFVVLGKWAARERSVLRRAASLGSVVDDEEDGGSGIGRR